MSSPTLHLKFVHRVLTIHKKVLKYLIPEHKSLKAIIDESQLAYDDFSFIKKRGNLHIKNANRDSEFVIHRKSSTVLNDEKKWEKRNSYKIIAPVKLEDIRDWNIILREFRIWIESISV